MLDRTDERTAEPSVREVLAAAVRVIGGIDRPGQIRMAEAVADAMEAGEHLLVQAGTGTGKSLAYLVPAALRAGSPKGPVVVATATIALQGQIVDRDLPMLVDAVEPLLSRRPTYAILKGRRNYVCLNKLHGGMPADDGDVLFEASPTTSFGREIQRMRSWAEATRTGDRDDLTPGVTERAWSQISVSASECVGAQKCRYGGDCFAEQARAEAAGADIVVTNHALLAIDAIEGHHILPAHDVVIVDEGHELVDRVTRAASLELSYPGAERALKRAQRLVPEETAGEFRAAADSLGAMLEATSEGRLRSLPEQLIEAVVLLRDAARAVQSAIRAEKSQDEGAKSLARAAVDEVFETTDRIARQDRADVIWVSRTERRAPILHVAPLSVAHLLNAALFADNTVILTSATLELGGSFDLVARQLGLLHQSEGESPSWEGLDVGSPFDYPRQGILYVARHLSPPGRDGIADVALDELASLIQAAGGRTLALFSSMRAAQHASEVLRERLEVPVLCQGDDQTSALVRAFAADARTCLFGTLSLWQGVDVPGSALQLVAIDRIPFPRPDDPLMSARAEAAGPSGFMTVSAAHAALRLAQGSGRLVRSIRDRGVVAVLDSRLATARYAGFLRATLPPFWFTTDAEQVRRSLRAIDRSALPPLPVTPRATRAAG